MTKRQIYLLNHAVSGLVLAILGAIISVLSCGDITYMILATPFGILLMVIAGYLFVVDYKNYLKRERDKLTITRKTH